MDEFSFESLVNAHYEPLYRFALSLARSEADGDRRARRGRPRAANVLPMGGEGRPVARQVEGQIVALHDAAPRISRTTPARGQISESGNLRRGRGGTRGESGFGGKTD